MEAGLRTWQKYAPFPEEMNRQLTDVLADFYFTPTNLSRDNLLKENHPESQIFVTGNTAIDAMNYTITGIISMRVCLKIMKKNYFSDDASPRKYRRTNAQCFQGIG